MSRRTFMAVAVAIPLAGIAGAMGSAGCSSGDTPDGTTASGSGGATTGSASGPGGTTTSDTTTSGTTGGPAQYVALTLASGPSASAVPVRTGVPFPPGVVKAAANLRLETGDGSAEIPAQFDAISHWPDGSVKVALTQLVTDLGSEKSYRVAYGSAVTRTPPAHPISVTGTGATELTVDTGLVKLVIDKRGLLQQLWRDANGDGTFSAGEQTIDSGDMFMVNAYDGAEHTASAAKDAVVTIEENGPLRAVIKASGSLTSSTGAKLVKYQVRYYAYAGSDKVDLDASIIDDRLEANVETPKATFAVAATALGMRWGYVSDGATDYRFGGENGATYSGQVTGEHYLSQNGNYTFDDGVDKGNTFTYSGVGSGARAPGWVALDGGSRHVALLVQDFWQQYPNELNVKGKTLTASLFPARALAGTAETTPPALSGTLYKRAKSLYFAREGGAKTYRMRLAFPADKAATADLTSLNDSYQRHRLDLMASLDWYTASGVFGDIDVGTSPTADTGYDAMLMRDIYEPSFEKTDGSATMFGWRDYGDRLHAGWVNVINGVEIPGFYNDTHVGSNNYFTEFVRTGDQRWFQLAAVATQHFMDIDVAHGPRQGYWSTGGKPQPAGEIHAIGHDNVDHQVRNMHWGHAQVSGLSDYYLLTGDKRSFDVLTEIAEWWRFVTPSFFELPFVAGDLYREAERDFAWPLYVMNEYVRVTGDAKYHREVSGHLASYLVQWWKTPMNHVGYDPSTGVVSNAVLGVNDASKGTGYWTMTKMDNNGGFNATGTNPWMAGALISNIIKFYEQDKQFAAVSLESASGVSHAELVDMLLQGMNFVVKYGYDEATKSFIYSEAQRGPNADGNNHIVYGLAYLDRLFKEESAAGQLSHPEWYDTQPMWGKFASSYHDALQARVVGTSTQSYGFYGYEIVYPFDFFKIMKSSSKP